jgi:hypothetical protein
MRYTVQTHRLSWPAGTTLDARQLEGCNIQMLVATGHLTPAVTTKKKWEPELPVTDNDSAAQPEE